MNIRHSSTGKRIVSSYNAFNPNQPLTKASTIVNLDISTILQMPNSSNNEALEKIKSKIAKNQQELSQLTPRDERNNMYPRNKNTFVELFPSRNETMYKNKRNLSVNLCEDIEFPSKQYNRRANHNTHHFEAMIRAADLFKLH
ncbi:hypothetical protein SteCoe_16972 [Stentor coeruleus]|uniref:Uncharacterized protein n=1 Tax=Stentor coeruleus TaxID=5963 RepID=A0A1R2C061_9CILI|nr:hypothetical protein SteCoe_16972 [Stentor coeruleus]